ncbi:hypothetical protein G3M53_79525, partial [Streptomyces sp. SID7982]|nr:hypothetical protein [Streptomyces sp. SID7982]
EAEMREVSAVTHYVNYDAGLPGVAPPRYGPTLRLPRGVADSYVLVLHGSHGRPGATSRSGGGVHTLAEGELGRVLRRRPSLERMRPDMPIFAVACELARLRPGADRLADPP